MGDRPRHVVMAPVGSAGDVHPFVGIGRALRERGHRVTIVTNDRFCGPITSAGLGFIATSTAEEFEQVAADPALWHPTNGFKTVARLVTQNMRKEYALLAEACREPGAVLVGHTISLAARMLEDKTGIPAATVHLAPSAFRSLYQMPALLTGMEYDLSRLPRWGKRLFWWLADRSMVDPALQGPINAWRRELGLPTVSRPFRAWIHSPRRVIGLFPPWFAEPQPDWPPQLRLTGFPLFDEAGQHVLDPDLEQFLQEGEPPIAFTPGSANRHAAAFLAVGVAAAADLGRRALLITRYPEQVPRPLPNHALRVTYVPFSEVLPRCAALVHHGGIGTCAQALAAGIPHLVMPMAHDQPDNAARLRRLGVGTALPPQRFTPPRVAAALRELLSSEAAAQACRQCASLLDRDEGLRQTCELIEALADG